MTSFHELTWPTKALSAGAALAMILSLSGCPSPDGAKQQTGATTPQVETDTGILMTDVGSDRVFFDYDSAELRPDALATLGAIGAWLVEHPGESVTIEGHCDERGTREYNLALGERRAQAVANYLAAAGVDPSRMRTISYGKERPAMDGASEAAWAQNRRAVFVQVN
ncbi:MAG TPA: peptidoglycan-associated lipoprotein Pal [Dongiaceae bacterium]